MEFVKNKQRLLVRSPSWYFALKLLDEQTLTIYIVRYMNSELVRLSTEDGLILQSLLYKPEGVSRKAYLHIHGMGGNFYENRFLDVMAKQLTDAGYAFLSINTRGHDTIADFPIVGEKEEYKRIGNAFEIFEECIFDIRSAVNYLESQGYTDITLCGHSLGAVKVTYYTAMTSDVRVTRLILMSPPDMISLAEAEEGFGKFMSAAKEMIAAGKGEELLPEKLWGGYYLSAKTYINLFTRDCPVDVFNIYDEARPSSLAKITVPTLAFFGEKDDAVTIPPPKALEIMKQKAGSVPSFETRVIEGANHGYFGKEKEMVSEILKWLEA